MNGYNKLKDETIKLTNNQVSDLVDKHFQNIHDFLEEQETPVPKRVRTLFELNEVSDALKYLLKCKFKRESSVDTNSNSVNSKEHESMGKLYNIVKLFSEEESKCLNDILKQYGEKIKGQDLKSVSVFEKIKLFFQRILRELKNSDSKTNTSLFYWDLESKEKQVNEPDREIEEVLEQKVSGSSTLETIVKEDEDLVNNTTKAISKVESSNFYTEIITPITQIAQEEIVPKATKQLVKPLIPEKSQKVIDAGNKIKDSRKTEIPSYTSQLTVNLKLASEKPKTEKQYGKNVANMVQRFESLNSNTDHKSEVKSNVKKLIEGFEAQNQEAATGRSR